MKTSKIFSLTVAFLASVVGTNVRAAEVDDTEVFFNQAPVSQFGAPNVLVIIDTSAWMGCPVGSTETDPSKCPKLNSDADYANTRIEAVRKAMINVLQNIRARGLSINVGFMRSSNNGNDGSNAAKGGFIGQEVALLDATQMNDFIEWMCPVGTSGCNLVRPNGSGVRMNMMATANDTRFTKQGSARAPLTEVLYEAYTYYAGRSVEWGTTGTIGPGYAFPGKDFDPPNSQVWSDAVTVPNCSSGNCTYKSPIDNVCQSNYIILLSSGRLASDKGNDSGSKGISNLSFFQPYTGPGTTASPGKCSVNSSVTYSGFQLSDCPDDLAYSLRRGGFHSNTAKASSTVFTYTIGFDVTSAAGADATGATNLLKLIATAGGGRFYDASNAAALEIAIGDIFDEVVIQNASFTSPTVSVNAFNRTLNLNDLYMAVFAPSKSARWKGNIKKYRLASNGDILDANGVVAVGNGLFLPNRQSLWSSSVDGEDVTKGGAASRMRLPTDTPARRVITNENGGTGAISYNVSSIKGRSDKNTLFNLACTPTLTPDPTCPTADQLVDWAYGIDVLDRVPAVPNGNRTESRKDMGDPLHTRPTVVIYGGTTSTPNINDAVVYAVTNDGYLHAFDATNGSEKWAFIPWDLLGRLQTLYRDNPINPRTSLGLDGIIRVLRVDKNNDGIIAPADGDKVYLYMGMRRGGYDYYAVDVTDDDSPKLMWRIGPSQLPNIGQTWSTPQVTRMNIPSTTQNTDKFVLVFGGGYDVREDPATIPPAAKPAPQAYVNVSSTPSKGAGVYVVDAISGNLLWWAGPDIGSFTPAPTLKPAKTGVGSMRYSIPGDVRVVDLTNDGYADLMYAADLGGQVWRFEVDKSATTKADAVRAGLMASFGGSGVANARRFFNSPDLSLISCGGRKWLNVALGSGNREMPISDKSTQDRFYSFRDYALMSPVNWSTYTVLTDVKVDSTSNMVDITPVPNGTGGTTQAPMLPTSAGWQLDLGVSATDAGEKVIVESRTFENTVFFTSFVPKLRADNNIVCTEAIGYNYLYVLNVCDGRPNPQFLAQTGLPVVAQGLAGQLNQKGIAPEVAFVFPSPDSSSGSGNNRPPPVCLVGAESCGQFSGYAPKRTFWQQRGAD